MSTHFSAVIWFLLGVVIIAGCQESSSTESTVESYWLKGDTVLIRLRDGSGWRLDLYQEGRGSIRYGRHPNNLLTFEQAGLDFDSLRWQVARSFVSNKKEADFPVARIAFLTSDAEHERSIVFRQTKLGREVFELAFEAGLNGQADLRAKRRMLKLFRANPPFGQ